jgi:hypothetical protein
VAYLFDRYLAQYEYGGGLDGVGAAQLRAALTLNQETILLYWSIGQDLASRFVAEGWGTKEMVWPLC